MLEELNIKTQHSENARCQIEGPDTVKWAEYMPTMPLFKDHLLGLLHDAPSTSRSNSEQRIILNTAIPLLSIYHNTQIH